MSAGKWEFDCPKFVDFAADLDEFSPVSPGDWFELNGRKTAGPLKLKNEEFGPKMATPKLKSVKSFKNSPLVNTRAPVKTDDEKLEMLGKLPRKESKSDCFLNRIGQKLKAPEKVTVVNGPKHRRSLSDCCLKSKIKMCPAVTPMCLKRTLNKDKNKKFKTTEELEMEKVLELRNELFQHLRLNEINFKRLKENKAPYVMNKFAQNIKPKPNILNEPTVKGLQPASRKLNDFEKNRQARFHDEKISKTNCVQKFKKIGEELQAILNPEPTSINPYSKALRDVNTVENGKNHKRVPFSKCDSYKGLKFLPNENKKTLPYPFSFDKSYNSSQNASFNYKENDKFSVTMWTSRLLINKENIHPNNGFHSETKIEKKVAKRN